MSSSGASPSLADRLVTACDTGDIPSVAAAVADGASVNEKGKDLFGTPWLPLTAAVAERHHDVAVCLLSHGADPNGDKVMDYGAYNSTAATLQLLIDAGGDVNRESNLEHPLFAAADGDHSEDNVRMMLAQPSLDLTVTYDGKTPVQYVRDKGEPALADLIAQEVSGKGPPIQLGRLSRRCGVACGWQIARRATLVRPLFCSLIAHVHCSWHDEACCGCGVVAVGREAASRGGGC